MIYLEVGYITVMVIVGYIAGLLLERHKQNKIKYELEEKIYNLRKYNHNLAVELDNRDIFIKKQTNVIDKLKWDNAEKDIVKHKIDSYKKGIAYEYK